MRRTDRLLGILLSLNDVQPVTSRELSERFEVSVRTIYRDIDALAELGIPIYAEAGRSGGYKIMEGYFLKPIMFSEREAISIILGQVLLDSIEAHPFASDLDSAEAKLLAAMPDHLRSRLRDTRRIVGFENVASDAFHQEKTSTSIDEDVDTVRYRNPNALDTFLTAIIAESEVTMKYQSPYRSGGPRDYQLAPLGMFWDRNCWYLVGRMISGDSVDIRTWRADRVLEIQTTHNSQVIAENFEIQSYLGRAWLSQAMADWRTTHPVVVLITPEQANRLKHDWYYRSAQYEPRSDGRVLMTFGQDRSDIVFELVRWLGPGAELLEPAEWRHRLRDEFNAMCAVYE